MPTDAVADAPFRCLQPYIREYKPFVQIALTAAGGLLLIQTSIDIGIAGGFLVGMALSLGFMEDDTDD